MYFENGTVRRVRTRSSNRTREDDYPVKMV